MEKSRKFGKMDESKCKDIQLNLDAEARGAALIEKIYNAQKEREECINDRLKRVTEEKEELMKKVKRLQNEPGVDSGVETNSLGDDLWLNAENMSLDEIMGRVISGKHSQSIEFNGELLLDRGTAKKKSPPKKSTSMPSICEDLKILKKERDTALKQVDQLTTELHETQRERSIYEAKHRKSEKNRLKILQNQMKGVLKERDEAFAKAEILQQELHMDHLKRFSKGGDFSFPLHKFNSTLDEYTHKVDEEERRKERTTCDELYTRMNKLVDEKNKLSLQLQQTVNTCGEEKKRADKLERLLVALRRRKER